MEEDLVEGTDGVVVHPLQGGDEAGKYISMLSFYLRPSFPHF